jgi:hypothetical protein
VAAGILKFDEALKQTESRLRRPSLLLGNGFSRAFSTDFSYTHLRDKAAMPHLSIGKNALFRQAKSDDFETVIDHLRQSAKLIELYDPKQDKLAKRMRKDAKVVQRGLIDALTTIHPGSAWDVQEDKYRAARAFLANFGRIFTLNYDLLLYWTVLQGNLRPRPVQRDGFSRPGGRTLTWSRPTDPAGQEIMYLHGAVHYYLQDRRVRKLEVRNGTLLSQLRQNLGRGHYPFVVTEGSREDKEARIARSPYLTYCHGRLRSARGDLYIHGAALSANDDHVLNAISAKESKIEYLYVSLHRKGSAACDAVQLRAKNLARERKVNGGGKLTVRFYDAKSAHVWG